MKKIVSCCGTNCTVCTYYPKDCPGCPEIRGRAFWLSHTGGSVCDIYACCLRRGYAHCGHCPDLPCHRYALEDPTKTPAQNATELAYQLEILGAMRDYDLRTLAKPPEK